MVLIRPRRALVAVLLAALVILVGCRARADVLVDVRPDGSGTVTVTGTFDEDAVAQLGGDVAAAVRTDDLGAAGWSVSEPTTSGSDTVLTLSKPFASADRLGAVLEELGGPEGPFDGWKLATSNSFTVSDYELTGRLRLTGSLDQFSDADVAAALDGFAVGRSPEELAAAMAADPDALTLAVAVRLPGEVDQATGLEAQESGSDDVVAIDLRLGTGNATDSAVLVRSSESDRSAVLWIVLGASLIVAAGLLFVAGARRSRRPGRPRRPSPVE